MTELHTSLQPKDLELNSSGLIKNVQIYGSHRNLLVAGIMIVVVKV